MRLRLRRRTEDPEGKRRSPARLLLPVAAFMVVVALSILARLYYNVAGAGEFVLSGGFGIIALWALVDGAGRAIGYPTYLGTGRGLDRLAGFVQAVTTFGIAIILLPNTVAFLEFAAHVAIPI